MSKRISLYSLLVCLLLLSLPTLADNLIYTHCPKAADLTRTTTSSTWATYQYSGVTSINLPEIDNKLTLSGNANAKAAQTFSGATWTDRTFLCLYNYQDEAIVIYETQLSPFVNRCYFSKPGTPECTSTNTDSCILTCERAEED